MTTRFGTALYPSLADAAIEIGEAMKATIGRAVASAGDVDVVDGDALDYLGSSNSLDLVGVEIDSTRILDGSLGPTRREQHVITLAVTISSLRITDDRAEPIRRAWDLLALIDKRIRVTEPDLTDPGAPTGHPSLWCRLSATDSASADHKTSNGYTGRLAAIRATFETAAIVQTV